MLFSAAYFPEEILRCAQDDNTLRGKEREKEGGKAAFFFPPSSKLLTVILSGDTKRRIS
jgi:hypothetical protein